MVDFSRRGRLWIPEAPMLNLIRSVELELASPAMGIAGVYGYEVGPDLAAGHVRERGTFSNLITDAGLDALGGTSISTLTSFFAVGTGNAPPAVGDGGLQTQIGTRVNSTGGFSEITGYNTSTDPANPYWYRRIPRVWGKGAFGGDVNLTELGVFSAASGGVCWSRQLFRDGAGLPNTVPVKADEELKVWYEYRIYPPMTDVVQTLSIKGVSTTVTNRAHQINSNNSWGNNDGLLARLGSWSGSSSNGATAYPEQALPSRTAPPAGSASVGSMPTFSPYVGGSRARSVQFQFTPAQGNVSGGKIGVLLYSPQHASLASTYGPFMTHLSPAPAKTTEEYMSISLNVGWARTPNPTI